MNASTEPYTPHVGREHLVVIVHNRLPWRVARRLVRIIDFGDGTYALGWRWSTRSWLVA